MCTRFYCAYSCYRALKLECLRGTAADCTREEGMRKSALQLLRKEGLRRLFGGKPDKSTAEKLRGLKVLTVPLAEAFSCIQDYPSWCRFADRPPEVCIQCFADLQFVLLLCKSPKQEDEDMLAILFCFCHPYTSFLSLSLWLSHRVCRSFLCFPSEGSFPLRLMGFRPVALMFDN